MALENLDIFEERDLGAKRRAYRRIFSRSCIPSLRVRWWAKTRGVGLVGAIELVANKETKAPFAKPGSVGPRLPDLAQEA